jgi:predicted nucleic acid-binding protein
VIIIVDSDGLIGILSRMDAHHVIAAAILEKLVAKNVKFIYPATVITEVSAVLKIRLKKPELAEQIAALLLQGQFVIEPIDERLLIDGLSFLDPGTSKHNTLFDGVVAAVAKKHQADAILSFDKFYKSKGFKLISDLELAS